MSLVASSQLDVLETFRVPCELELDVHAPASGRIVSTSGAEFIWICPRPRTTPTWHRIATIRAFAAMAEREAVARALEASSRDWQPGDAIADEAGSVVGHVYRATDGSVLLPFDPNALVRSLLREEYVRSRGSMSLARRAYYQLRPAIPRRVQIAIRRRFAGVQERVPFPAWPAESSLHDLYGYLLQLLEEVEGAPLPWIAPWPAPYEWSVVLTHDVEQSAGYEHVDAVVALERREGVRSAWYFVPERDYRVDEEAVAALADDGFEICVHGLHHDGRDLSPGVFEKRLPAMRTYAEQWGAVGFRSPATQREWERIARLGFEHDSSYSDVARYEPQPGGSCSWFPFFVGEVVELPITLPMDHTLFELLEREDGSVWFDKAKLLRERGGLALLLTHPDYLLKPSRLAEYRRFVAHVAADSSAWLALPREAASWWRRRAASSLRLTDRVWRVHGPASSEARVRLGVSELLG